jgi:hypothetical protein
VIACLASSSSGIGWLLASHDGNWKAFLVDFCISSDCVFISRPSSWIPESFDVATFFPRFIDCFWFEVLFDIGSIFFGLLLSVFNEEMLLANEIKSVSPIIASGEGVSLSYGAVQQRQATRQRTILKCAS